MALITRISRLFTADFHAVLDRIEEPDVLLKHAIREMEQALHDTELRLNKLVREQRQLAAREAQAKATFDKLDGELDLCFESGEESLARNLIRKKLSVRETEALVRRLQNPPKPKSRSIDPDILHLQEQLRESLCAQVRIQHGKKGKGKLVISYNSVDELEGIIGHLKND